MQIRASILHDKRRKLYVSFYPDARKCFLKLRTGFYCWIACDVMAAMLVVKDNSLSLHPLGTKLYFYAKSAK